MRGVTLRGAIGAFAVIALAKIHFAQAPSQSWKEVYQQSQTAHEQKDFPKYREAIHSLRELLSGHAETLFAVAKAEALAGDKSAALHWLDVYARAGLYKDVAAEPDL